jgi:hypothetical protein
MHDPALKRNLASLHHPMWEGRMYITLFDLLNSRFDHLHRPGWRNLAPHNRALVAGLCIVVVLLLLSGTAVMTHFHYVPLIILGLFCGGVTAKVLGQFLAPRIQSHVTAFLSGITTGNIGSSESGLRKLISNVADQINKLVALLPQNMGDLSDPLTLGLWIALLTALIILAANAYYANQDSSPVGNLVLRADAVPATVAGPAVAAGRPEGA